MNVDVLARRCLRAAARRWPAEIRDEMEREWLAELSAMEAERAAAHRRLGFALSLLTSPPARDTTGVPRGWAETLSAFGPGAAVMLLGLATYTAGRAVDEILTTVLSTTSIEYVIYFPSWAGLLPAPFLIAWGVATGRWLGRRQPMSHDGRFGAATSAVLAPLGLVPALLLGAWMLSEPYVVYGVLLGVAIWVPGTALTGIAVARAARRGRAALIACLGAPVTAALAAVAATVPMVLTSPAGVPVGLSAAWASLTFGMPPDAFMAIPEGAASGMMFYSFGTWAVALLGYAAVALSYGRAAARPHAGAVPAFAVADRPEPGFGHDPAERGMRPAGAEPGADGAGSEAVPAGGGQAGAATGGGGAGAVPAGPGPGRDEVPPGSPAGERGRLPGFAAGAGAAAAVAGVLAWAWTQAVLTPDMDRVAETAPTPGGPSELYMWVAELRWAAILLATLGMLVAVAERRYGVRAALVFGALLLAANAGLQIAGLHHPQLALLAGGVAVLAARAVAGTAPARQAGTVRRRVAVAAVTAAACGPMILFQSTPFENHPFLPLMLPVTTGGVAVVSALLAVAGALAISPRRTPPVLAAALLLLPAGTLAVAGLYLGNGATEPVAAAGTLVAGPLAVLVVALARRHRPRRRAVTAVLWGTAALVMAPIPPVLAFLSVFVLHVVPDVLFMLENSGWAADGFSVLPSLLVLVLPAAALFTRGLDGRPAPAGPLILPRPTEA
ncbi:MULTISPECIES: hypothetical protein [Catenuloplanes]|uniref:Uncharacterized protein n=1 Tax=Catenuloplanes niger TaxID=587534 RepID=A0AAE3ZKH6_9ACTN|nr:hypothetical protein [Catenuloplanes niger]MDR7319838.1 hypothetical protein [Catenuloplanes niger]